MSSPTLNRFRKSDFLSKFYWSDDKSAFDKIIENPESQLLTQDQLFEEEGGYASVFAHVATIGLAYAGLFMYKPNLARYFIKGNLRFHEWLAIGATGAAAYRVGYGLGVNTFGDASRVNAHWAAFYWQKSQNRFEGRVNLMKAPKMF